MPYVMSLWSMKGFSLPPWLVEWMRVHLVAKLGLNARQILAGLSGGIFDTLLLLLIGLGVFSGGHIYMASQYNLPVNLQDKVIEWAIVADYIARETDIPREVPLVLWFKENSMLAENPENCTGIIGAYDLVRSGEAPCFEPGPINNLEISAQLSIGAVEFKKRCPEITYYTQDPETIKRCYLAYNAGTNAAARLDPDQSAYVMNNYDAAHTNMVYSDIELGTVQVTALGAWPAHLTFQSLIITQLEAEPTIAVAVVDARNRFVDWVETTIFLGSKLIYDRSSMSITLGREANAELCLGKPHENGRDYLRPTLNPVSESPLLTQNIHGCHYSLPGLDISSKNRTALLQAPMRGEVTTYTDQWYNSTIRIENEEWIVWLLHPRSYLVAEGEVRRGQAIGVMGAIGNATGPHVHYTIYDKVNETFVDPALFLP